MNIMLLQGPLGPFFHTLAHVLTHAGHSVWQVCFNAGDELALGAAHPLRFHGEMSAWGGTLRHWLQQQRIDAVICYGDCRAYHRIAGEICRQRAIAFWALEEGYLRPDYITLEQGGVNAFSPLYPSRDKLANTRWSAPFAAPLRTGNTFALRAQSGCAYYLRKALGVRRYPHYQSHRPWSIGQEAFGWVRGYLRKLAYQLPDQQLLEALTRYRGALFLAPLQVSEDFQLRTHSNLAGMEEFISRVLRSFARHARDGDRLLFKHHPMDRGHVTYRPLIERLAWELGLSDRVYYGIELPLPALYPLLKGVVTVNSTVGLSALLHKVPTYCLGRALYDIEGLTSQGTLAQFWREPSPVCPKRFERLRLSLLHLTQLNGSFYQHLEATADAVAARITGEAAASALPQPVEVA